MISKKGLIITQPSCFIFCHSSS